VFGQEINALTSAIARMNLYLNGVEDFSIVREDTLARPAFVDGSHLRKFDIVLANPPYSISEWNRSAFEHDKWGRNLYGTPPQGRADYAFIQHIVASMDDKVGRCAILLPHGILFRNEEADIRKGLVLSDKIEAVIGLGPNLFYNAPMEACVLICNNRKSEKLKDKVIFINAKYEVTRKNAESFLEDSHIDRIVNAYHSQSDINDFKRLVDIAEIEKNRFDLSIQKYVYISEISKSETLSFQDSLKNWESQHAITISSLDKLFEQFGS
jgi:type I restriction enzyme M protein